MPKECQDSDPLLRGDLYAGGTYIKGGIYMLVYTVIREQKAVHLFSYDAVSLC